MTEYNNLELKTNVGSIVEFEYDNHKEGKYSDPKEGQHDTWYRYAFLFGVEKAKVGYFASLTLHNILKNYKKGDVVEILKDEYEKDKIRWIVTPQGETPKRHEDSPVQKTPLVIENGEIVTNTSRETAFREACRMHGLTDEFLKGGALDIIAYNTDALQTVLEGTYKINDKDLPF
ncbi:hypothetical protein LCGC14_1523780 [marine sediment metagenome]|uniref:Uncharacterized protein n=1 Tax=marine sediment metagenome TaxID=412755 RepID=A0A0F9LYV3_9ZZZZ|nr:hypothetical protein [Pricia sp.]